MAADRQRQLAYTRVNVLSAIRSGSIDRDPSRAQRFLDALGDILRPDSTDSEAMGMLASEVAGAEVLVYALHLRIMRSQDWSDPLIQWLEFIMAPVLDSFSVSGDEGSTRITRPEIGTWNRELETLERDIVTRPFPEAIELVCARITGVREILSEAADKAGRIRRRKPGPLWGPLRSVGRKHFRADAEGLLGVFLEEQTRSLLASSTIVRSLAVQALADYWMH